MWRSFLGYLVYPQWSHLDFYLNSKKDPTCLSALMSWCLWHVCRKKFHGKGVEFAPFGAFFFDRWYYFLRTFIVVNVPLSTKSNVWGSLGSFSFFVFFLLVLMLIGLENYKRSKPQRNQKESFFKCSWAGREIWYFHYIKNELIYFFQSVHNYLFCNFVCKQVIFYVV